MKKKPAQFGVLIRISKLFFYRYNIRVNYLFIIQMENIWEYLLKQRK